MAEIDYRSAPLIPPEAAAAERHLVVWSWIFYGMACAMGVLALCTLGTHLLQFRPSREGLIVLALSALFFGVPIYVAWALGWRCSDARKHLLAKSRDDFLWIVYAFNAMVAICVVIVIFSVSCIGIIFSSHSDDFVVQWWLIPCGAAVLVPLFSWTLHRLRAAERALLVP